MVGSSVGCHRDRSLCLYRPFAGKRIVESEDDGIEIIERLMDKEYPYGGVDYSRLGKEASAISATLSTQLGESGKRLLEDLLDIEMQRNVLVQQDAFTVGVCTGVRFMCEALNQD